MESISYSCINLGSIKGFNELLYNENENVSGSRSILKLIKSESYDNNKEKYSIIQYDKSILNNDLINTYGLCRSVIVNSDKYVVCFAPPKSIQADTFFKLYPEKSPDIIAEEFVEGTMINVFFDPKIGRWEIATKRNVGATNSFFRFNSGEKYNNAKTFRTMFLEAAKKNNLVLEKLNQNYCYSFVLQHPENRIVVPFKESQLYLIAIYLINNTDKNNIRVHKGDMSVIKETDFAGSSIKFPQSYEFKDYNELIEKYASMNTSYDKLGFILYNKNTGERTKVRNPVYEEVRQLRGNQPKLQFHYLSLRKEGKVGEFLKYYPESKNELSIFRDQIHLFTKTLYENYVSCYIKKEKILKDFTPQFKGHMFILHQLYKNELREQKKFITLNIVIDYVNKLETSFLMYSLNYNFRQHNIDVIKNTNMS